MVKLIIILLAAEALLSAGAWLSATVHTPPGRQAVVFPVWLRWHLALAYWPFRLAASAAVSMAYARAGRAADAHESRRAGALAAPTVQGAAQSPSATQICQPRLRRPFGVSGLTDLVRDRRLRPLPARWRLRPEPLPARRDSAAGDES